MKNTAEIKDISNDANQTFNFLVECTCGWQGRSFTKEAADIMKQAHEYKHQWEK